MQARMQEADELRAIVVTSIRTARRSSTKPHSR
jgi:hypothetical protein